MKGTILILEDIKGLRETAAEKLTQKGFKVLEGESVEEGRQHLENLEELCAVWLDHYLAGPETGLDFARFIKQHEKFKTTPVFLISNAASIDDLLRYRAIGVEKFYSKIRYTHGQLVEEVEKVLKNVSI